MESGEIDEYRTYVDDGPDKQKDQEDSIDWRRDDAEKSHSSLGCYSKGVGASHKYLTNKGLAAISMQLRRLMRGPQLGCSLLDESERR